MGGYPPVVAPTGPLCYIAKGTLAIATMFVVGSEGKRFHLHLGAKTCKIMKKAPCTYLRASSFKNDLRKAALQTFVSKAESVKYTEKII